MKNYKSLILNVELGDEDIMEALEAEISEIVEKYGFKPFSEEMSTDVNGNYTGEKTYYPEDQ